MRLTIVWVILLGSVLSGGCNAVYFYETEKVSLTIEVRPDATGPVQGSFGLKQRIVAFVPKRNGAVPSATDPAAGAPTDPKLADAKRVLSDDATMKAAMAGDVVAKQSVKLAIARLNNTFSDSDAMSVLSSMRIHKLPKPDGAPFGKFGHLTIDSALITGGAARVVAHPGESLGALTGQQPLQGLTRIAALRAIYTALKDTKSQDIHAEALVRALDDMAAGFDAKTYPCNTYQWSDAKKLATDSLKDKPVNHKTFGNLLTYWAEMQDTANILAALPGDFTLDDQTATPAIRARLSDDAKATAAEADRVNQKLHSQKAVKDAADYFSKTL